MTGEPKQKRVRTPKPIQFIPGKDGPLGGLLYDDGRAFLFTYTKLPNQFRDNPAGEGFWSEIVYPDLTIPKEKKSDTA